MRPEGRLGQAPLMHMYHASSSSSFRLVLLAFSPSTPQDEVFTHSPVPLPFLYSLSFLTSTPLLPRHRRVRPPQHWFLLRCPLFLPPRKDLLPKRHHHSASITSFWSLQKGQIHPSCIVSLAVFLLVTGNKIYPGQLPIRCPLPLPHAMGRLCLHRRSEHLQ
jgi:hypothetical protein